MLLKTLKWPYLGVLIAGTLHFTVEAIWPDLQAFYPTSVLGIVQFAFGLWTGYLAVRHGGNFFTAILCGALLGLFPLVANPLCFWLILHREFHPVMLAGVFGFTMMFWGGLVGGGFAVSMKESTE